jgi:hypothetical protein
MTRAQTLLSLELLLRLVMVCMLGSSTVLLLGLVLAVWWEHSKRVADSSCLSASSILERSRCPARLLTGLVAIGGR